MFRFLLFAFIVAPIAELYVIIQVGSAIGVWETIGLLILNSLVGAWLVRRQGFSILAKVQSSLAQGVLPTDPLIDGLLVVVAGALLLTPGFITDGLGLLLLLPPSRALMRGPLKRRFTGKLTVGGRVYGASPGGFTDVHGTDTTTRDSKGSGEPPGAIELGPSSE